MKLFIQMGSGLSLLAALTGCKPELAMPSGGVTSTDSSSNSSTLSPLSPAASASHILSGRKAYDSEGSVITGSMANLGVLDLSQTPASSGYYSSTSNAPTVSQICAAETILGVTGSRICQNTSMVAVSSDQILSGNTFYDADGNKRSGSITNQGILDLTASLPASGYYSGVSSAPSASNIKLGTSILGVTGTAIVQSGTATTPADNANVLSGKEYWDSSGAKQTGTLQEVDGSKSAMNTGDENDDTKTSVEVTPSASQLFQKFTIDLGAEFKQENICSGKTIFGRVGTAACALAFGSGAHRTPGSATQRDIPVVATDDDGFIGDNPVTRADTSSKASCGTSQATIAARISDCAISWDGEALGKMGEGKWSLVTKANGHEVWKDERTGMLWGGNMGTNNWCQASGNIENDGGIDCSPGNGLQPSSPVSMCAEGAGLNSEGFNDPKGGMRKVATPNSPSVSWRLPTRRDYLQAYANGMAYVLPGFLNNPFWTASVVSSYRYRAWDFLAYDDGYMFLYYDNRDDSYSVQCVGR